MIPESVENKAKYHQNKFRATHLDPHGEGPKFISRNSGPNKFRSRNSVQKFRSQNSGFSQREFGDISGPVSAQQFRALVRGLCPSSGPHNRGHNPEIMLNPNALYLTMAYLILLDPTLPSSFKFTGCPTTLAIPPTVCYMSPAVFLKTMYSEKNNQKHDSSSGTFRARKKC